MTPPNILMVLIILIILIFVKWGIEETIRLKHNNVFFWGTLLISQGVALVMRLPIE